MTCSFTTNKRYFFFPAVFIEEAVPKKAEEEVELSTQSGKTHWKFLKSLFKISTSWRIQTFQEVKTFKIW